MQYQTELLGDAGAIVRMMNTKAESPAIAFRLARGAGSGVSPAGTRLLDKALNPGVGAAEARSRSDGPTSRRIDDWVSEDDPMTGAQASQLETLSEQAHDPTPTLRT